MEPVKITDTKDWSSIDVFLFSNGQQYLPPRKYHLRSDDLQWWEITLSYLGRTHYGSGHSPIELFTIDGTKINGPLELINGAAYVAVEPPDCFINTGYEEYLLRASRSWEKRLAQKPYNSPTLNSDLKDTKDPATQGNPDGIKPENIADTPSFKVNSNEITSPQKTRPAYQRFQRKSIANSKQVQKKKSSDTHGTVLKRICAETDKCSPGPKKTSITKNGSINRKPSTTVSRKLNEKTNQELLPSNKRRGTVKPGLSVKAETPKNLNVYETVPVREPIIDLYNNKESDLISLRNDLEFYPRTDNSVQYHNQNNLTEANIQNEHKHSPEPGNNQDFEKHSTSKLTQINEYEQSDVLQKNEILNNQIESGRKHNINYNYKFNNNKENTSYDNTSNSKAEKQVIDEYIAHMNKGGLLLLKLKVKLKDCKTIFNIDKSKDMKRTKSLLNLPKTEKTSQVDINISFSGELLKTNDQQYTQDKSLQSLLNKYYTEETNQINNKSPRIIILPCACHDFSDKDTYCLCDTFNGCEFKCDECDGILYKKLNETFTRCECHNESFRASKDENAMENDILIQSGNDAIIDRPSLCKCNNICVKDLAQKYERSVKTMPNDKNTTNNNKQNSNNTSMNDNQEQSIPLTRLTDSSTSETVNENLIGERSNDSNSKNICSKSTQTDWCNMLLEARFHDDDNYTFHLPSLYVLKQYKL